MMYEHWNVVTSEGERTEKAQVRGLLKIWAPNSLNVKFSVVMMDVLRLFKGLQKEAQRSMITLSDLLVCRGAISMRLGKKKADNK
jgi:hypothetical protein